MTGVTGLRVEMDSADSHERLQGDFNIVGRQMRPDGEARAADRRRFQSRLDEINRVI